VIKISVWTKVARTEKELLDVFRVRYEVFVKEEQYLDEKLYPDGLEKDEYDELDITTNFITYVDGKPAGTHRLIRDSPRGFTMDRYVDLSELRKKSKSLVETSRYTVLPEFRGRREVWAGLLKISINYSVMHGFTDACQLVNLDYMGEDRHCAVMIMKRVGGKAIGEKIWFDKFNVYALPMHLKGEYIKEPFISLCREECNTVEPPFNKIDRKWLDQYDDETKAFIQYL